MYKQPPLRPQPSFSRKDGFFTAREAPPKSPASRSKSKGPVGPFGFSAAFPGFSRLFDGIPGLLRRRPSGYNRPVVKNRKKVRAAWVFRQFVL